MSKPDGQKLGELSSFFSGGTPSKANPAFWHGDIPWLTPKDMSDFAGITEDHVTKHAVGRGTRLAPENAIYVAVRGMSLHKEIRIVKASRAMSFNQDIKAIIPKQINRDFLFYALNAMKPFLLADVESAGHGTGRLPTDKLCSLKIPRFGDAIEMKIGSFFSDIDAKIELNRQMNETLEAMAQAIFKDWFIDFGPVRRKLAGTCDPVAVMGGISVDVVQATTLAALFPDALGDDGLPVGWKDRPFADLVEIIGGGTPKTSDPSFWNGNIPWFSVVDTPSGSNTFVFDTEKSITRKGLEGSSARMIAAGTTIITARGTVGNLAIAGREMTFNQSCYALQSKEGSFPYFVYLATGQIVERLKSMAHGSVFSTITRQTFEGVYLGFAPIALREAFEKMAIPLFERVKGSVQESRTLAETRDYLLPKLMSGEVRVREAEKLLENAL